MRETGIVRRIDELGRVVIPKELRKTLRIKEGDPLEIYTENEQLLFRKYSPLSRVLETANISVQSFYEITGLSVFITDTDKIISAQGKYVKDTVDKKLTDNTHKIFQERKTVHFSPNEKNLQIYVGEENINLYRTVMPIVNNGDCFGGVVVYSMESVKENVKLINLIKLTASIISRCID